MDRSLKWRTLALFAILLFCVATLAPSFVSRDKLPTAWPFNKLFGNQISLGLDLQGGKHIVYNIALDRAVEDKASEIKRDLETRMADDKLKGSVALPNATAGVPNGAVTVKLDDPGKLAELKGKISSDYAKVIDWRECSAADGKSSLCFFVSQAYADGIKKSALTNAVATIRDRINEKGVAEPSVVEKGDDIIVELPGDPKSPAIVETQELIARTAKLEMKVVDDCFQPPPTGCTKEGNHTGSAYMLNLYRKVGADKADQATDPDAIRLEIRALADQWKPDEGGVHKDKYLKAPDRDVDVPLAWARKNSKLTSESKIHGDKVTVRVSGREIITRWIFGDPSRDPVKPATTEFWDASYGGLVAQDASFKLDSEHQLAFEQIDPLPDDTDKRSSWRTYYLEKAVRLTGSGIENASGTYDQTTNRPVVSLEFNRFGGRIFGDVTSQIVGMKFATILDDKVKSAPTINGAIRGGRAQITMGGSDARVMEKERDDLVAVLKTGSLPAPLVEATHSDVGPTLGRDAIDKTKFSFAIGIALVILIMVGVYRWSGWIAVFAVVFHILLTLAVMAIFGATLTLPGIAAIVLSIGMEVDGNILIYERIRDELNLGKSVRGAIDLGFSRAFTAILDGQLTTAAAGWVLLQYGSGPIKGFAVMLLVGVFTTLTTNIWVTRILFDWNVARKKGHLVTISI